MTTNGVIAFVAAATPSTTPHGSNGGLTWGTLVLAVVAAASVGGFLGNLRASNRLRPPRISVYAVIEQRLEESRER